MNNSDACEMTCLQDLNLTDRYLQFFSRKVKIYYKFIYIETLKILFMKTKISRAHRNRIIISSRG